MKSIYSKPICNNNPSSAPLIKGRTFFLCWRCSGGVLGGFISILFCFIFDKVVNYTYLPTVLLVIPGTIDYFIGRAKIVKPNNQRRFITGILMGIPIGFFTLYLFQLVS